ncbi:MAG TPA: AarF/UbiB family protein [Streptosporangiaceae bacterium]|nr:AarF/UbiB family protein [Streptosporangiaceae bacterium]
MTAYPAAGDYYKAVQVQSRAFTVPKLQAAEFVWDSLGPTLARGSSAVVFQASVEGQPQALRCYIRNDASSRDRYSVLDAYLAVNDLSPHVSGATWLDGAIQVNRATWPVLTMEWIDGRTLNEYVDFLVTSSNTAALTTLAAKWRALVALLQDSEFAHGDLQHGNVMVDQEGRLRLVDFDGVWIQPLAGQSPPTEFGHPNYQHPLQHVWDRWLDTFSALVIYLSLVALGKEPSLWLALYNSKNLLFAKSDFFPPFKTEAWKQLATMGDPQVDELVRRLQECCDPDWVSTKSLEMTLDQQAVTPARQPIPAEQRWWEKKPVAAAGSPVTGSAVAGSGAAGSPVAGSGAAGSPVAGSAADGPASRPRPQGTPSAVPPATPATPAAATAAAQAETARIAAGSLPAPPPLSAPLGLAGTGPMPQLSQTMAPPGATMWWSGSAPGSASAPARPGPVPYGSAPSAPGSPGAVPHGPVPPGAVPHGPVPPGSVPHGPVPPGSVPHGPGAPVPGPSASAPPASATKPQPGPVAGAITLGLGILLLIIGAVGHVSIIVIGGLVAAAWGIWRIVTGTGTGTGSNTKPPGQA